VMATDETFRSPAVPNQVEGDDAALANRARMRRV
jgi:hypothetical protein